MVPPAVAPAVAAAVAVAPEVRIEHRYPEALAFLRRHGPEALAVVHDLLGQSAERQGQLVVQASVRQVAERLGLVSKDGEPPHACPAARRRAATPPRRASRRLRGSHLRARSGRHRHLAGFLGRAPLRLSTPLPLTAVDPALSQLMTDECTTTSGTRQ